MAIADILSNKGRSFLTMLGIIIGISSVVAILATGSGISTTVTSLVLSLQEENSIILYSQDKEYSFTESALSGINEKSDVINYSYIYITEEAETSTIKGDFYVSLHGKDESFDKQLIGSKQKVKYGRCFSYAEYSFSSLVCIIDEITALKMFGTADATGNIVNVEHRGRTYDLTVVGVISYEEDSPYFDPEYYIDDSKYVSVYLPLSLLTEMKGMSEASSTCAYFILREGASKGRSANDILNLLKTHYKLAADDDTFYYYDISEESRMYTMIVDIVTIFVTIAAAISLLVGGIGVMNIMLVCVTERTREIGIRRSLGATRKSIIIQFIAESAIITMIGGVIGVVIGCFLAYCAQLAISAFLGNIGFSVNITLFSILGAVLFSSFIGVFFGYYPAKKAAALTPIDALRNN